jgi:hypothetical protein
MLLLKICELMHCVPTTIISSLFIGFDHISNDWKVEKVNYEFDIESYLRLYLGWSQKFQIFRLLKSDQHRISAV